MRTFKEHIENPLNHGRPIYYNFSCNYGSRSDAHFMAIYVELDSNDEVKAIQYEQLKANLWTPILSSLSEILLGYNLDEVKSFSWDHFINQYVKESEFIDFSKKGKLPFFNIPLVCLNKGIDEFRKGTHEKKSFREGNLICRCFGVYEKDIEKLVKENYVIGLKEISEKLDAGLGCTSCHDDIEEVILKSKLRLGGIGTESNVQTTYRSTERIEGKTPAELILEIDKIIHRWKPNGKDSFDFEIIQFVERKLVIKVNPIASWKDYSIPFENYLRSFFAFDFDLLFVEDRFSRWH